jgi:hypothetical protein
MKILFESLPMKHVCSILSIMVFLLGSGCAVVLAPQPLDPPVNNYSDQIGTYAEASGIRGKVGWGRLPVFYIPAVPIHIVGDGNERIMVLIQDALKRVGYNISEVGWGSSFRLVPYIKCTVERFWFNNYIPLVPIIPTWGEIQLEINLISPDGKTVWSEKFLGRGHSYNFFNGYTRAVSRCMRTILNDMVEIFSSEEFHSVLMRYTPNSQVEKSIESKDVLENKLNRLEGLKDKQLITDEEYLELRKKAIKEY